MVFTLAGRKVKVNQDKILKTISIMFFLCLLIALIFNRPVYSSSPSLVYDCGDPTNGEQLFLELLNRARSDPQAEGVRLGINISEGMGFTPGPRPPLAMNALLLQVARSHSEDMYVHNFFSHDSSDGKSWYQRITGSGYTGELLWEVIAMGGPTQVLYATAMIDSGIAYRGHRAFLLGYVPYNFPGSGGVTNDNELRVGWSSDYLTVDGCRSLTYSHLLGVVYNDVDGDGFYDPGEGLGGVTVMPNTGDYYAITSSSGGYAIPITTTGPLEVTASGGALSAPITKNVNVAAGTNVKQDFTVANFTLSLNAGWNMVSFPVIPANTSFASIFSGVGYYQVPTWSGTSYTAPANVEAGRGYWVLVLSPTLLNVTGVSIERCELDLPAGWSMIGSIYHSTANAAAVFPSYHQLLTWDGFSYVTATTIEPGKGYWALVLEPTSIVVG